MQASGHSDLKTNPRRLFFANYRNVTILMKSGEKAAPPWFRHNTKQRLQPFTSITKYIFKLSYFSCALAGKTAGGIRFSLTFLVIFASRQKEQINTKPNCIYTISTTTFSQIVWLFQYKTSLGIFIATPTQLPLKGVHNAPKLSVLNILSLPGELALKIKNLD